MAILKIRDAEGNVHEIHCIKGDKGDRGEKGDNGDAYVLTDADKQEIAEMVASMLGSGDEVSY